MKYNNEVRKKGMVGKHRDGDMKPENVKAEGFESHYEYMLYLQKINKKAKIDIDLEVRAYRFEYIPPHPLNTCPQCSLFNYACSCDSGKVTKE